MAKATKAARERAHELGVDIKDIEGTGHGGQVTQEDVDKHQEGHAEESAPSALEQKYSELEKDRLALQQASEDADAWREERGVFERDWQDSRIALGNALALDSDAPSEGELLPNIQLENVSDVARESPITIRENDVSDQKVRLAFNPAAGASAIVTDDGRYHPGDEVSVEKFDELKVLQSDGHKLLDEENSEFLSQEEQEDSGHADSSDGSAQENVASADEQKED